jgi:hypothetical protein
MQARSFTVGKSRTRAHHPIKYTPDLQDTATFFWFFSTPEQHPAPKPNPRLPAGNTNRYAKKFHWKGTNRYL